MQKIKFVGFDMDYTLAGALPLFSAESYPLTFAEYKTAEFEMLAYKHIIERLISIGYPEEIRQFEYTPHFPVRCALKFSNKKCITPRSEAYGSTWSAAIC